MSADTFPPAHETHSVGINLARLRRIFSEERPLTRLEPEEVLARRGAMSEVIMWALLDRVGKYAPDSIAWLMQIGEVKQALRDFHSGGEENDKFYHRKVSSIDQATQDIQSLEAFEKPQYLLAFTEPYEDKQSIMLSVVKHEPGEAELRSAPLLFATTDNGKDFMVSLFTGNRQFALLPYSEELPALMQAARPGKHPAAANENTTKYVPGGRA